MAWLTRFKALQLSEADARALVVAREIGAMDNQIYREVNKVDTLTASQALKRLRDHGLFEQKGRGSATWYKPTPRMPGEKNGAAPKPRYPVTQCSCLVTIHRYAGRLDGGEWRKLLNELPGELAAPGGRHRPASSPTAILFMLLNARMVVLVQYI